MPVISALRRMRQEDLEFQPSLDYIERLSQKNDLKPDGLGLNFCSITH
jgi:hypothetical protein